VQSVASTAAATVLVGVMLLTVLDVASRFLFNAPVRGAFELTEVAMVAIAFLGLGQAHRYRQHITIDLLYAALTSARQRVLDLAARTLSIAVATVVAWQLWAYLLRARVDGEVTGVLRLPLSVLIGVALVGIALYGAALVGNGRQERADAA
jgi:TRAP-type C4-dicarboxylate transport system permease small subunit